MANRIDVTKLNDGPLKLIYHVFFESDGASGDLTNYVLIDPATEDMYGTKKFSLQNVTWTFNGFTGVLLFNDLVDGTLEWVLPSNSDTYVDFTKYGGLLDRSSTSGNGKLMLNTIGFGSEGDVGSIIIEVLRHS